MSKTLLIKNARVLVTMDDERREIANGAVFIRDNVIEQVGVSADLPLHADEIIDATNHVVMPGLINTHHHMYQSLTRVIPAAQNGELFNWLTNLYPIWANLTPEMVQRIDAGGDVGADPIRLHHQQRSPVHLPERLQAR